MKTVLDKLRETAHHFPERAALVLGKEVLSYSDLWGYVNAALLPFSVRGKTVVLKKSNPKVWVVCFFSLLHRGANVLLVAPDTTSAELDTMVKSKRVVDYVLDEAATLDWASNRSVPEAKCSEPGLVYLPTSGSTGTPNICIKTLEQLTQEGLWYRECLSISSDDQLLALAPLYHAYALGAACMATYVSGATLHVQESFVPRRALKVLSSESITILILVPFMAKMLVQTRWSEESEVGSLRVALSGTGSISSQLQEAFKLKVGIHLSCNYGSTETGGFLTRLTEQPQASVGKAMYGVEVEVFDEKGRALGVNQIGELGVKSFCTAKSYLNGNHPGYSSDGFFMMKDFGFYDGQNNFFIKGRKNQIINVAGKKVYPGEVEQYLLEHSKIVTCRVFAHEGTAGEEVAALVVTREVMREQDIYVHCQGALSAYKIPRKIKFISSEEMGLIGKLPQSFFELENHGD